MRATTSVILIAILLIAPVGHVAAVESPKSLLAPLGERMMADPFSAPEHAQALADAYASAPLSLESLYVTSLNQIHDEFPLVVERAPLSLAAEIARADALAGQPRSAASLAALSFKTAELDPRVERALASLVAAANDAAVLKGDPFARSTRDDIAFLAGHSPVTQNVPEADFAQLYAPGAATDLDAALDALSRVDLASIHRSHVAMARGVDSAVALLGGASPTLAVGTVFEQDTQYGRIRVQGNGNDFYPAGDNYFVLVDLGGNDRYENRAGASGADLLGVAGVPAPPLPTSPAFPAWVDTAYGYAHRTHNASILIDVSGNDQYVSATEGAQGFGGYGGFGALVDIIGADSYSVPALGQGAGQVAGAGFLVDVEGADVYSSVMEAQGFGIDSGAGFLADGAGNDLYLASIVSQGTGYSANLVGLLLDVAGNDDYRCTGEEDFSGSILPVNAPRPGTICHAAGFGGTGVQVDLLGDDDYTTFSSFQALTLIGTGILVDGEGDDNYTGGEWSNGVGVLGAAVIVDGAGDDRYTSIQRLAEPWADIYVGSNGEGYLGVGVLADASGNDNYLSMALKSEWLPQFACGAGCGFSQGVGILIDGLGNDRYHTEVGEGAGVTGVGVLVDQAGDDVYTLEYGSFRGQGYSGEDNVFFLDEGITECWYGILWDGDGRDSYSNPQTTIGTRGNDRYWGQGDFGRGIDGLAGARSYYENGQLEADVRHELNTLACNQFGL